MPVSNASLAARLRAVRVEASALQARLEAGDASVEDAFVALAEEEADLEEQLEGD